MITWIARLLVVFLISSMCAGFVIALPWALELRDKHISKWTADASGSAVPVSELTASPPPFSDDTLLHFNDNLNSGPGRGMKTASGSGRRLYSEAGNE